MKKIIISSILLGAALLTSCNNSAQKESYTVTKEQFEQACTYDAYLPRILSLDFTVTYTETLDGSVNIHAVTKFDHGKIFASPGHDDFYCLYREGSYSTENRTWSFDYYYQEESEWKIQLIENETTPDDVYLPDIGFMVSFEELRFNSETNCYEQISGRKVLNMYYFYSEIKVKFVNGNIVYASWKYSSSSDPDKIYFNTVEVTNYGSTVVNLPNLR